MQAVSLTFDTNVLNILLTILFLFEAAFTSAVYHVLYNASRFRVMDGQGMAWRVIFTFLPLVSAFYNSFTGIADNLHFLQDVLFGAFMGSVLGFIFFHIYFPGLFDTCNSGRAYPPRKIGIPFLLGPLACFWPLDDSPRVEVSGILPPEISLTLPPTMETTVNSVRGYADSIPSPQVGSAYRTGPNTFPLRAGHGAKKHRHPVASSSQSSQPLPTHHSHHTHATTPKQSHQYVNYIQN